VFGAEGFRSRREKSRSLRKPRPIEEKLVAEGPVDLDLGLTKGKPENRLGPEIGPTARPGVTIEAIRGTSLGIRVPMILEAEEVWPLRKSQSSKKLVAKELGSGEGKRVGFDGDLIFNFGLLVEN
jgi:hypothetical protein